MKIDVNDIAIWLPIVQQLVGLGVSSYAAIRGVMEDAGADEATIAALEPKWDALVADVKRAAGG